MDYAAYSTESPARPLRRPNACDPCGAFRRLGEEYFPPTTHFAHCRYFIDQGVIRMAGPAVQPKTRGQYR